MINMTSSETITTAAKSIGFGVCGLVATIGAVDVITEDTLIPIGLVAAGVVGLVVGVWKVASKLQSLLDKIDGIAETTNETRRLAGENSMRIEKIERKCDVMHQ